MAERVWSIYSESRNELWNMMEWENETNAATTDEDEVWKSLNTNDDNGMSKMIHKEHRGEET